MFILICGKEIFGVRGVKIWFWAIQKVWSFNIANPMSVGIVSRDTCAVYRWNRVRVTELLALALYMCVYVNIIYV